MQGLFNYFESEAFRLVNPTYASAFAVNWGLSTPVARQVLKLLRAQGKVLRIDFAGVLGYTGVSGDPALSAFDEPIHVYISDTSEAARRLPLLVPEFLMLGSVFRDMFDGKKENLHWLFHVACQAFRQGVRAGLNENPVGASARDKACPETVQTYGKSFLGKKGYRFESLQASHVTQTLLLLLLTLEFGIGGIYWTRARLANSSIEERGQLLSNLRRLCHALTESPDIASPVLAAFLPPVKFSAQSGTIVNGFDAWLTWLTGRLDKISQDGEPDKDTARAYLEALKDTLQCLPISQLSTVEAERLMRKYGLTEKTRLAVHRERIVSEPIFPRRYSSYLLHA